MSVEVKLFGPVRDVVGRESVTLEIQTPCSCAAVFEMLATTYPDLRKWRSSLRVAVNLEYVSFDCLLHERDEVGLLPPVSGG